MAAQLGSDVTIRGDGARRAPVLGVEGWGFAWVVASGWFGGGGSAASLAMAVHRCTHALIRVSISACVVLHASFTLFVLR